MEPNTGHLIVCRNEEERKAAEERGYVPIPEEYSQQAYLELMGKDETYVGKNASGTISTYLRKIRKLRRVPGCK